MQQAFCAGEAKAREHKPLPGFDVPEFKQNLIAACLFYFYYFVYINRNVQSPETSSLRYEKQAARLGCVQDAGVACGQEVIADNDGWLRVSRVPPGCRDMSPPALSWSAPPSEGHVLPCPYQAQKPFLGPSLWAKRAGGWLHVAVGTHCPMAHGFARASAGAGELPAFVLSLLQGGER